MGGAATVGAWWFFALQFVGKSLQFVTTGHLAGQFLQSDLRPLGIEIHRAPLLHPLTAPHAGIVSKMDAGLIGRACIALGAGRTRATDSIDFAVGCSAIRKIGASVERGQPLLIIHARDEHSLRTALPLFESAVM